AARRVSDTTRQALPAIAWQEINGMRNRLVHEYDDIDLNIVWDVIQADIPDLIEALRTRIPPEPHTP
ncbi:MAG: HepT-like ribonuclease domain-containing protein, partial [Cyanobacteria bacterium P01_A01_bin.135]